MTSGEFLTRATIWITILAYTSGVATFAIAGQRRSLLSLTRILWTAAWLSLVAHIGFAFHFYHGWSHYEAYQQTARETFEVFGLNWGGGLYINYLLLAGWFVDLAAWWTAGLCSYVQRPWPVIFGWHGFMIFIIFNATVVFETGWVRWCGAMLCAGTALLLVLGLQRNAHRTWRKNFLADSKH